MYKTTIVLVSPTLVRLVFACVVAIRNAPDPVIFVIWEVVNVESILIAPDAPILVISVTVGVEKMAHVQQDSFVVREYVSVVV